MISSSRFVRVFRYDWAKDTNSGYVRLEEIVNIEIVLFCSTYWHTSQLNFAFWAVKNNTMWYGRGDSAAYFWNAFSPKSTNPSFIFPFKYFNLLEPSAVAATTSNNKCTPKDNILPKEFAVELRGGRPLIIKNHFDWLKISILYSRLNFQKWNQMTKWCFLQSLTFTLRIFIQKIL